MKKHSAKLQSEWCTQFGLRKTKMRGALFLAFENAEGPQSVPQIQETFAKKKYYPNKTSIYREIESLLKKGILFKVQLSEKRVSFEIAGDHHHHFVCNVCDSVTKISFCESIMQKIEKTLVVEGKIVVTHNFELFGICENCH